MRSKLYLFALVASLALAGCTPTHRPNTNVVRQTYIHKYGVTVPPEDWTSRGQHGQVVSELNSGVSVTRSYSSGVLDGATSYTFPHSSAIERTETYARGNLIKESTFYRSGPPQQETEIALDGAKKITAWYETGSPKSIEDFDTQGLLVKAEYFTPTHQSEAQVDNKHGIRITRNQYGHIVTKDTIEEGQMVVRTTFHYNGSPKAITPFKNSLVDGKVQSFLPDGEPNSIEQWVAGKQQGLTILFQNGEKYAEVPYLAGRRQGVEKRYRDGSLLTQEVSWVADLQDGPTTTHAGDVKTTEWYFEGHPIPRLNYEDLNRARR